MNNRKEFSKGFDDFIKAIHQVAFDTVKELSRIAVEDARSTTAFHNKRKEATHFIQNGLSSVVQDDRPYAIWLEEGNNQNGPYIYPKNAKALHFTVNGQEVFASRVRSHGPYKFVEHGRDLAASQVQSIFGRYFEKAIKNH